MSLRLYNTLTREKQAFVPLDAANVRMYVCGPTVYDFAHIGNARPVIVFDVLYRLLRHLYGADHVTYARNITDVDDKIIVRAREDFPDLPLNEAIANVTSTTEDQFHDDLAALGCLPPSEEPHATKHIPYMIAMIKDLIAHAHAYAADGHVLFAVKSFSEYGQLARRSTDEMIAGARVEVAPYKKDAMDFVLWKPSGEDEPGWDSPWGRGRPGWHIECSAMSAEHLGQTFDIHGGGIDLVFPHHENEVAQSRCAFGTGHMAQMWMHNGYLQVEGRKMSKSEGNFVTIRDLLGTEKFGGRKWPGSVLRLAMLMTQYRQPIDWTVSALDEARTVIHDWSDFTQQESAVSIHSPVVEALSDDLNSPRAIAELHRLRKEGSPGRLRGTLELLGLSLEIPVDVSLSESVRAEVDGKIEGRNAARAAKDFAEADRIRDELANMGIQLKDGPEGTTWEIVR